MRACPPPRPPVPTHDTYTMYTESSASRWSSATHLFRRTIIFCSANCLPLGKVFTVVRQYYFGMFSCASPILWRQDGRNNRGQVVVARHSSGRVPERAMTVLLLRCYRRSVSSLRRPFIASPRLACTANFYERDTSTAVRFVARAFFGVRRILACRPSTFK